MTNVIVNEGTVECAGISCLCITGMELGFVLVDFDAQIDSAYCHVENYINQLKHKCKMEIAGRSCLPTYRSLASNCCERGAIDRPWPLPYPTYRI